MPLIAIVGPDGAGKSTVARMLGKPIMHQIPYTSRLPKKDILVYRITHEFLMGLEKMYVFAKQHIQKDKTMILDRCYIDAFVYASLWSEQTNSLWPYKIARFFNHFAYQPELIFQLYVDPFHAKPKRNYRLEELKRLNELYHNALLLHDYSFDPDNNLKYKMGVIRIWRRTSSSSWIRENIIRLRALLVRKGFRTELRR